MRRFFLPLTLGVMGLTASTAQGCPSCSAQWVCTLPGYSGWGEHVGLVIPILAAFLERPFFSWAGVRRGALPLAIQSSFISGLATFFGGMFALAIGFSGGMLVFILWMPVAILLAAWIKWRWASVRSEGAISLLWVMMGSVFSALVIALIPVYRSILGVESWVTLAWIRRNEEWWLPLVVFAALLTYLVAFVLGPRIRRNAASLEGRGFEVLPIQPDAAKAGIPAVTSAPVSSPPAA